MYKNIILALCVLCGFYLKAQVNLDSLYAVWQDQSQSDLIRSKAYSDYIWEGFLFTQPDSAFILAEELVLFGFDNNSPKAQAGGYTLQGVSWANRSDYSQTLDYYKRALEIYEQIGNPSGLGFALNNVGTIYDKLGEYPKALEYYKQSLQINEQMGLKYESAVTLSNIGTIYMEQGDFPKALDYNLKSLEYNKQIGYKNETAVALSNIGEIYMNQGDYTKAMDYYLQSLEINKQIGQQPGIASSLTSIGVIYQKQGEYAKALNYCHRGYDLSLSIESLEIQKDGCSCLYKTYKAMGDGNKALKHYELVIVLEDSLHVEDISKKLQKMEFEKVILKDSIANVEETRLIQEVHEEEIRQKEKTRNISLGVGAFFLLLAGSLYIRWNYVRKSKASLQIEKDRSEGLLLNILPEDIAQELKETGKAAPKKYESVSILFTDFKDFTKLVSSIPATRLIVELNEIFSRFDDIIEEIGIEKIETIGDAYMAASGLPRENSDHALRCVEAAFLMVEFLKQRNENSEISWNMRVGINSGPVVAGVVGKKKFAYDIFGDSVNTASRMESNGQVGKVNISQATYELLKNHQDFAFEYRGKIEAKGKGEIEMYFVSKK
ncbi:adenylate/guanylate cyclase domain-containing protein [Seonamhaeicola maritimus]|uniref:adenylate cyclase n=1 Tax=Seonamhaeicola maritimus TaxID=2591822 RepID=A0A5C7GEX6_9FLAO|nr:adenylate/guanylate cyclase domain-containing protein [Seonamhaeicola maritimus]TXG35176.1 tetratricopeptide repeat protein [Seonamhaeicola maritimus]